MTEQVSDNNSVDGLHGRSFGVVKDAAEPTENLSNKDTKLRLYKTIALYATFVMMGLSSPLLGTTFVHMEKLFHVSVEMVTLAVMISSGGYLMGAVTCAFIYDHVNPEISFAAFNLVGAVSAFVASYAQNFNIFIAAMVFHEMAFGFDDAAGQSYCVRLWSGHKLQKPLLQGVHAVWSLGGMFGPMIIKLFLSELDLINSADNFSSIPYDVTDQINNTLENNTLTTHGLKDVESTRHAFIAMGVLALVANLPFIILSISALRRIKKRKTVPADIAKDSKEAKTTLELLERVDNREETNPFKHHGETEKTLKFKVFHVVFIFTFTMLNLYTEFLPILFLVSFALKHLEWSVMSSSLLLSLYFGAHFAGRIVGILISVWLSPRTMLSFNLTLTAIAHLVMLTVNHWPGIAWFSTAIAGFGVSTTFPTNVLWISETTPMTGKIGAIMIIGSCCGTISSPYVVATVTSVFGQMGLVYVLVIAAPANALVFLMEACFVSKCA